MLTFLSVLNFLGFTHENTALFIGLVILIVVLTFFYLKINNKFDLLGKDISHIKENLNNHITDTNKKIDKLDTKVESVQAELKEILLKK